jgi:hypothetical protein
MTAPVMKNWIEYIRERDLFEWGHHKDFNEIIYDEELEQQQYFRNSKFSLGYLHHICYHYLTKALPQFKSEIKMDECAWIKMGFVPEDQYEMNDIGFHPISFHMHNIRRYTLDGKIHNDEGSPAITVKDMFAVWNNFETCKKYNITHRPGPIVISILGYKEYWDNGVFIRAGWNDMRLEWNPRPNSLASGMQTAYGPDWKVHTRVEDMGPSEKKIIALLHSLEEPATPFNNKFFNSVSDEFRYLDLVQGWKKL